MLLKGKYTWKRHITLVYRLVCLRCYWCRSRDRNTVGKREWRPMVDTMIMKRRWRGWPWSPALVLYYRYLRFFKITMSWLLIISRDEAHTEYVKSVLNVPCTQTTLQSLDPCFRHFKDSLRSRARVSPKSERGLQIWICRKFPSDINVVGSWHVLCNQIISYFYVYK